MTIEQQLKHMAANIGVKSVQRGIGKANTASSSNVNGTAQAAAITISPVNILKCQITITGDYCSTGNGAFSAMLYSAGSNSLLVTSSIAPGNGTTTLGQRDSVPLSFAYEVVEYY